MSTNNEERTDEAPTALPPAAAPTAGDAAPVMTPPDTSADVTAIASGTTAEQLHFAAAIDSWFPAGNSGGVVSSPAAARPAASDQDRQRRATRRGAAGVIRAAAGRPGGGSRLRRASRGALNVTTVSDAARRVEHAAALSFFSTRRPLPPDEYQRCARRDREEGDRRARAFYAHRAQYLADARQRRRLALQELRTARTGARALPAAARSAGARGARGARPGNADPVARIADLRFSPA